MSEPLLIDPDVEFRKRLMAAGGETLSKCYQCGTCTVVCPLSPDGEPFPRKELLWAQWGLKDRLMTDGDVWLCHQCNDCSRQCPREAAPGDVMAVVRQSVVEEYARPGWLAKMVSAPKWLPALILVPALLIGLAIVANGGFNTGGEGGHHFHANGIFAEGGGYKVANFDNFFAHYPIVIFFTGFVGLSLVGAAMGLLRYWKALDAATGANGASSDAKANCIEVVTDILTHRKFRECEATKKRYWGHLLLFYGFAGMFVTTALAAVLYYVATYPFGWFHPVKMLGNVSGVAFLVGLVLMVIERLRGDQFAPRTGYADWLFIIAIAVTVVTGMVCQTARLWEYPGAAYAWYYIHLVFVFFLLVYLPYSKFAHLLYRIVAMIHAKRSGREAAVAEKVVAPAEETPAA